MRTYRLLLLVGSFLMMTAVATLGGQISCCVCANCPGVQCFEVPGSPECNPAACIQNGCAGGQATFEFDMCNTVPACTAQPAAAAAAPALSPLAGGAALLGLVVLARRALTR